MCKGPPRWRHFGTGRAWQKGQIRRIFCQPCAARTSSFSPMTASSRSTSPGRCRRLQRPTRWAGRDVYRVSVAAVHAGVEPGRRGAAGAGREAAAPARRYADRAGRPGYAARRDAAQVAAIRTAARPARRICSVCTGAFLLAEAGLLDDRKAATHWRSCARLAAEYPNIRVLADPIWSATAGSGHPPASPRAST